MMSIVSMMFFSLQVTAVELDASIPLREASERLIANKIYTRAELKQLIGSVEKDQSVIKLFNRQVEAKPWYQYKKIFLDHKRIYAGKAFLKAHHDLLDIVYAQYGVPPEIITALIGVETFYGQRMGSRSVLRSLVTLAAYYPRRATFFAKELETFLGILKTEKLVALNVEGSYAGAIGIPQFMPSSYAAYAVDFNKNGRRDLVYELEDAVASVANYLSIHGWKRSAPISHWLEQSLSDEAKKLVSKRAKPGLNAESLQQLGVSITSSPKTKVSLNRMQDAQGERYFVGYANFYALTRYNPSNKYAMAIVELSEAISKL